MGQLLLSTITRDDHKQLKAAALRLHLQTKNKNGQLTENKEGTSLKVIKLRHISHVKAMYK